MYNKVINCIPSKEMQEYLLKYKQDFSVLQLASIVTNFGNEDKKIKLLEDLLRQVTIKEERLLIDSAIQNLKNYENPYTGKTKDIYNEYFFKKGETPIYPLSEICNFPVFFKKGDIIKRVGSDNFYYVDGTPILKGWSDITDECYLCYLITEDIKVEYDLFVFHDHINVCKAEKVCYNDLTIKQLSIVENIKKLLESKS